MNSIHLPKKSLLRLLAGASLVLATPAIASTIFEANFDGPPYGSGSFEPLPTGDGVLTYGAWFNYTSGNAWLGTTDERAYSGGHSLILDRIESSGAGNAQVLGFFGTTNTPGPVESAISFSMAIRVTDNSTNNWADIAFRNSSGDNVFYAFLGRDGGIQLATTGHELVTLGSIAADQWYILQFIAPDVDGTSYTANLFAADGTTLLGTQTLGIVGAATGGYSYFSVGNSTADSAIYIDDIRAEAIPEPNAMVLGAAGLLLAGWKLRRRA